MKSINNSEMHEINKLSLIIDSKSLDKTMNSNSNLRTFGKSSSWTNIKSKLSTARTETSAKIATSQELGQLFMTNHSRLS